MHSTLTINANVFSLAPLLLLVLFSVHLTNANPVNHTSATTTTTTGIEYDNATIAANVSTEVDESTTDANSSTGLNASPVSGAEPPLRKCEWTFSEQRRNKLFFIGQHELVFHVLRYIINKGQRRCYVTRNDLESKLDASVDKEVIVGFAFACRDLGTELIFLENEEAEQLSGSSPGGVEDQEAEMNDINVTQGTQYRFYPGSISYFQSQNCRIHAKAVWMVGNMTDFRVFTAIGERAVDLAELENGDRYCEGFRNLVSFSIVNDWTLQDNLHYLTRCKGYLDNVVEMELYNNSLTSFPDELRDTVPNLGSLQVQKNHLTSPVEFPWKPGFVALPRNLSRTYQFNSLYNYRNSFDMQPNLFRKILILSMNNITNLTHFQFSGEFQYIKLENNSLREISDDVFDNVPSLQFLSLAHNELQNIPEDLFSSLQSLTGLDLQGNKLTRLPNDTFRNVRSLETLNLQDNQLEVLQDGLFTSLRELKNVMLKNNNLMTVSDGAFSTLSVKLTSIDLQHNPLIEVPPIVFLLRGLKNINLEHTDIEVLDFTEIDLRTDYHALINALKNPTTGEVLDNRDMPESQKFLSLRFSRLRSIVIYNVTEETGVTFLLIIKHFTIYTEGSKLACDCNILNVTHFLEKLISDDKLLGTEACLSGWRCIWPDELSGKPVVDLLDNETYCPLEDDGKVLSCPDVCTCYVRTEINTVIVDCKDAGLKSLSGNCSC
nr:hypothetical protein BaRGS_022942 [Batillaria attramentaria]